MREVAIIKDLMNHIFPEESLCLPPNMPEGVEPDVFFKKGSQHVEAAKAICKQCPVLLECGFAAAKNGVNQGIIGG